ncbi:hypothetical protein SNE40_016356 [Patella caerulea]
MRFGSETSLEYKNFLANQWKDIIKFKRRPVTEAERKDALAAEREKTEEEKFGSREKREEKDKSREIREKDRSRERREKERSRERREKDRSRERREKDRKEDRSIVKTEKTGQRKDEGEKKEVASQGQDGKRLRPQGGHPGKEI